jgi:hypothetical protein
MQVIWERKEEFCMLDKTCALEDEPLHDTILSVDKSKLQPEMNYLQPVKGFIKFNTRHCCA